MRIYASQFQRALETLSTHYILFGKEQSLIQYHSDQLNAVLKSQGFERAFILIDHPAQFDWSTLLMNAASPTLFSPRRFYDIYLPNAKVKAEYAQVLLKLAAIPDPNLIWIIRSQDVDAATQKSAWWQAWEKLGVVIQHPLLNADTFLQWIVQYSKRIHCLLTEECLRFIRDRYQGNLPAAKQTIDMLALAYEGQPISLSELNAHFKDQSLFSTFEICDLALQGRSREVVSSFEALAGSSSTELPLLVWALNKTLCELSTLATNPEAFEKLPIWANKRSLYHQALKRLRGIDCQHLIECLFHGDTALKSGEKGLACQLILNVLLHIAGKKVIDFKVIF
ncbi:MAG: DNA polymerase III subunit delta [Gammaproteobacteria bacterium]